MPAQQKYPPGTKLETLTIKLDQEIFKKCPRIQTKTGKTYIQREEIVNQIIKMFDLLLDSIKELTEFKQGNTVIYDAIENNLKQKCPLAFEAIQFLKTKKVLT